MSHSIDLATAQHVARLARIHLTEDDAPATQQQLSKILDYVSQLNQIAMPEGTEPFFGAVEFVNAIRADVIEPSSERDLILENAPSTDGEFYLVPPVFKQPV